MDHIDKKLLKEKARNAVHSFVNGLDQSNKLMVLTDEYNACNSEVAKFAKAVDKLECVLEFKKYQDLGQVSLSHLKSEMLSNKYLKSYVDSGKYDLANIFFLYHMPAFKDYGIDEEYWYTKLKPLEITNNSSNEI